MYVSWILDFRYFVDPEVLDNVPSLFLLLGGIFAGLQLMGLLLIQIRSKSEIEETEKYGILPIFINYISKVLQNQVIGNIKILSLVNLKRTILLSKHLLSTYYTVGL